MKFLGNLRMKNDQELSAFKVLRIFTRKLDVSRNESGTASDLILQNFPRDDFAPCLISADVNQVKGERFSPMAATTKGDILFNSSSILDHSSTRE